MLVTQTHTVCRWINWSWKVYRLYYLLLDIFVREADLQDR